MIGSEIMLMINNKKINLIESLQFTEKQLEMIKEYITKDDLIKRYLLQSNIYGKNYIYCLKLRLRFILLLFLMCLVFLLFLCLLVLLPPSTSSCNSVTAE